MVGKLLLAAALALALATGVLFWLATSRGLINTAKEIDDPAEIRARTSADLGAPLPDGVTPVARYEDGFQDLFVLTRLSASGPAFTALMDALGLDESTLAPAPSSQQPPGAGKVSWWDVARHGTTCRSITLESPTLAYLHLTICRDESAPDLRHIYLQGNET